MRANHHTKHGTNLNVTRIAVAVAALLVLPLIAMQLTNSVSWSIFDFAAAGVILMATGLLYELVITRVHTSRTRKILGAALLIVFMLIWLELAVGVVNAPYGGS